MIILFSALALLTAQPAEAPASLSPRAEALIAPVREAMQAEREAQALLPPPVDDRERLIRMGRLDQAGRQVLTGINLHDLPPEEIAAARDAMWAPIEEADQANIEALMTLVPEEGWFLRSVYGEEAASAAFHIVQHSDTEYRARFVPVLEPLVASGEIDGQSYGMMYDRWSLAEGRPQRYGSQMTCDDGRWVVNTLEEPETVNARRAAMGFHQTLEEYEAFFQTFPPCT